MATLEGFRATENWQELPGVSGVANDFTVQNTGKGAFAIFEGETVTQSWESYVKPIGESPSSCRVYNKASASKIWVRSIVGTNISIIGD